VADLFKLQDEVVARLTRSLGVALTNAEAEKGARSKNPDALDLTMQGWSLIPRALQQRQNERRESEKEARTLFDRALKIDPNDADALAGSAITDFDEYMFGWGDPKTDYEAKILGQARSSDCARPQQYPSLRCKGLISQSRGAPIQRSPWRHRRRTRHQFQFRRSLLAAYRRGKLPRPLRAGEGRRATGDAAEPARPHDRYMARRTGRRSKAIDTGTRTFFAYTNLAAAYAHVGKMAEAKAALVEARQLNPNLTVKWMIDHSPNLPTVFDGVRKAGLPED
jgi:tetratricopeptide (TPR) repeat protein